MNNEVNDKMTNVTNKEMNSANNVMQLFDQNSSTFTYILFDESSREAAIIDPVDQHIERDLAALNAQKLKLKWVIETHAHADHLTSAGALAQRTGARTAVPAQCGIGGADTMLNDGTAMALGADNIVAIHTPGHTAGSMCFIWRDALFTGDTLLIGGCGRTDFQSGNAGAMYDAITQKLFSLPDATRVLPAHDYKGRLESTIGAEKRSNPRLADKSRDEFIQIMNELNLPPPKLIDIALPANQRLGASADGLPERNVQPAAGYAGNLPIALAHDWWQRGAAVIVDVRTQAERDWVGMVPGTVSVPWKKYPGMAVNPDFDATLKSQIANDKPVLFLCRSGVRSIDAARRAQSIGYTAYNILEGFEGDPDTARHRSTHNGWRHAGYAWVQD